MESRELERLAEQLGVSMFNTAVTKHGHTDVDTYELQRRIREALNDWRDGTLWLFAVISALISVISVLIAWAAVRS